MPTALRSCVPVRPRQAATSSGVGLPFQALRQARPRQGIHPLTWVFAWERVTRIELTLSAWEVSGVAHR